MKRLSFAALCLWLGVALPAFADSPGPAANVNREYPPSCLAYPLDNSFPASNDPVWSTTVTLPTVNSSFQLVGSEQVTYVFWRSPCSGGKAALLGQVQRATALQGTSPFPIFGQVYATQGSAENAIVRTPPEPNTNLAGIDFGEVPVYDVWTFVLEEGYTTTTTWLLDYTQPMTLTILGVAQEQLDIPVYDPSDYADAFLPMQLSGYLSGGWYDPNHSGEGFQIEIGETEGSSARYIVVAWYTYDAQGIPYWVYGAAPFTAGDRSVTISQMAYFFGGRFAGGAGFAATPALWGSITLHFADCNTLDFSFQSAAGLPSQPPAGSGTRTWTRVTQLNGLTCQ
jgi:hypothetical protein